LVLGILHGKVNFPTTFREPLWISSSMVISLTIEDGNHGGSQNVVGKFTLHTVQNPQNQKSNFSVEKIQVFWYVTFCQYFFNLLGLYGSEDDGTTIFRNVETIQPAKQRDI
jgi:hypothetical protein